jgi:hypothetical protein
VRRLVGLRFVFFIYFDQYRNAKWALDLSTTVEKHAYEKSHGIKVSYREGKK